MKKPALFLTCEHGGNGIPQKYRHLFKECHDILESHRGWDIGALKCAKVLAKLSKTELHFATISRLLVDLNRSYGNPTLFSDWTNKLPSVEQRKILELYYDPYHQEVSRSIAIAIKSNQHLIHISIHSFTPILNGKIRNCDVGLLHDPNRPREKAFVNSFREQLNKIFPDLRIRLNYPYRGTSDGLTRTNRQKYSSKYYSGIELEINQELLLKLARTKKEAHFYESLNFALNRAINDKPTVV